MDKKSMILDSRTLNIGYTILNRYKIKKVLGEGNFSFVYLIQDICDKKKHFVLKEFYPHSYVERKKNHKIFLKKTLTENKKNEYLNLIELFKEESKNLKKINHCKHPGIPNFISFHKNINNTFYIIMDYIPTTPLQQYITNIQSPKLLIKLLQELLLTLEHIHYYHIYHQDIKMENILIKEDGTPLLIDYGASAILYNKFTGKYLNTTSPDSAAIEQLSINYPPEIDERTDVYSVAALIYKILTNTYPISSKIRAYTVERGEADPYISLYSKKLSCFSKHTLSCIDKALCLYAEERYSNTKEFRMALKKKTLLNISSLLKGL